VGVAPGELERVVAGLGDLAQVEVAPGHELAGAAVALAVRAGAIAAEDLVGEDRPVAVGPADLHDPGAVRCLDAEGHALGIAGHGTERVACLPSGRTPRPVPTMRRFWIAILTVTLVGHALFAAGLAFGLGRLGVPAGGWIAVAVAAVPVLVLRGRLRRGLA